MRSCIFVPVLLFALVIMVAPMVYADDIPTATIGSFKVNPSVLMPGSLWHH